MRGERQLDWEMLTGRAYRACQWIVFALILLVLARTQVHAADVSHIDAEAAPIASSAPITSGEDRVKVKAEGFIHIAGGGKEVIAQDGVEVHYQDMVVYADKLLYLAEESLAWFDGHVQMEREGQHIQGESLQYDFKEQKARIDEARAVLTSAELKGDVYLRGDIETVDDDIFIIGGSITTCDLDQPHFHLRAGELEIYPGNKMVIRDVSYWEGRIPLFYWPYLVIPLDGESAFEFPQVGYSPSEGWFVKMAYNYYKDAESYGKIHLEYMQKKGIGTGVRHTYFDKGDAGKGQVLVYRLQNPQMGITTWEGDWEQTLRLSPTLKVELGTKYWLQPERGLEDDKWQLHPRIGLTNSSKNVAYTIKGEHRRFVDEELNTETELDWRYRQELSNVWRLSSSGHGLRLGPWDTEGSYLLYDHVLQRTALRDQFTLKLQRDVHPALRGRKYTSFTWETLERLPEVTWQSRNWSLFQGRLPVKLQAQAGYYRETYPKKPGLAGTKLQLEGGIAGKRLSWGPKAYVTYDGSIGIDSYRNLSYTGEQEGVLALDASIRDMSRLVILSRPRLVVRPLDPLTLEVTYKDQWVIGESPFLFDEMKNSETLSGKISWQTASFGASLGTGYDFWSHSFNDVVGQVHIRPSKRYELNVGANYSIEDEAFKSVRGVINLMPRDDLFLRFASTYNFTHNTWDHLNGQVQITLPNRWRFEYVAGYSGTKEEWTNSSAVLALDLHCRELRLRYDHLGKAVWLEYSINAFPQTRITMGGSEQLDFRVDGLADLVTQVSRSAEGN